MTRRLAGWWDRIGPDESVTVCGMKGTGKTTLCRLLAREMAPCLAWDPFGQYAAPVQSYRPPAMSVEDFDRVAGLLYALGQQGRANTFMVEEAEQVLPEVAGGWLPPAFKQYALMGRNLRLRCILNTRRVANLSKSAFNNARDWMVIFKAEGDDLDYLKKRLGRENGPRLEVMRSWVKDPRQGGGRYFTYHDGELVEHPPLPVGKLGL